jgi:quercetin dioxygenase-like cupin family protein
MSTHSLREVHDQVALYVVGALPMDEAREFEGHLDRCELCQKTLQSFSSVGDELAIATAVTPQPSLRARLLQRISGDWMAARLALDGGAVQFVRSASLPWEQSAISGMQFKLLYRDADRGCSTKVVRLAPGTTYPSHRHGGVEELFVIEGDALVSGVMMRAGDYCRAEPGTMHTDISTSAGVLFFSMSSDRDEVLE